MAARVRWPMAFTPWEPRSPSQLTGTDAAAVGAAICLAPLTWRCGSRGGCAWRSVMDGAPARRTSAQVLRRARDGPKRMRAFGRRSGGLAHASAAVRARGPIPEPSAHPVRRSRTDHAVTFLERPEGRLAIALGIGLVIGAERERRKGEGPVRVGAGIRTFTIVALLGGVVAALESEALLVVAALVVGAVAIVAYCLGEREDPGFTTEVSLVLTYCLGALAQHQPLLALAAGLSVAMLLALRARLHRAVRTVVSEDELRDALLFGVAAVVVLPLIPDRTVDPLGVVNPFTLWRLVVVIMGMSAVGYIAQRAIGPRYGLALAGFGAGFVSSSATIAAMGARVRADPALLQPAVAGATASTVATFVQLAVLVGAAAPSLLATLAWPLAAGGAAAAGYAALQTWRARRVEATPVRGHAFKLSTAVLFAVLVTAIGFASALAHTWFGSAGAVTAAAVAGLADAHASAAAIASMTATGQIAPAAAVIAVLLAFSANTMTKLVLALTAGPRAYWMRVGLGLVLVLGATWSVALLAILAAG